MFTKLQLQVSTGSRVLHSLSSWAHEPTKALIALGVTLDGSAITLLLPFFNIRETWGGTQ